jgi:hypothetical protein
MPMMMSAFSAAAVARIGDLRPSRSSGSARAALRL